MKLPAQAGGSLKVMESIKITSTYAITADGYPMHRLDDGTWVDSDRRIWDAAESRGTVILLRVRERV